MSEGLTLRSVVVSVPAAAGLSLTKPCLSLPPPALRPRTRPPPPQRAFIRGAVNLPAHSFYPTLASVLPLLRTYKRVIFHCQSSSGRGPRCAGWLQDALDALPATDSGPKPDVVVLAGGIKEWWKRYGTQEGLTVKIAGEGWSD